MSTINKAIKSVAELVARLSERLDRYSNKADDRDRANQIHFASLEDRLADAVDTRKSFTEETSEAIKGLQVSLNLAAADAKTAETKIREELNRQWALNDSRNTLNRKIDAERFEAVRTLEDRVSGALQRLNERLAAVESKIGFVEVAQRDNARVVNDYSYRTQTLEQRVKKDFRKALPLILSMLLNKTFIENLQAAGYEFDISKEVVKAVQELVDEAGK